MNKFLKKQSVLFLLCFFTPAVLLLIVFALCHVAPFGDNSIAVHDANIQYVDFFRYYRHIKDGTDDMIFSFTNFLGDSGVALFAYYLASPFNFLILLFKEGQEHLVFSLLVLLKLSTAGLTSGIYLKNRFCDLREEFVLLLSVSYALMQYSIAQSANIMWLDGVYMFPLVLLGIYQLVRTGKSPLFIFAIGFSVLFNWYAGYFNCIGAIYFFIVELLAPSNSDRTAKQKLISFGSAILHGAAGLAISAVFFLPSIKSLLLGKGQSEMKFLVDFNANPLNVLSGFAIGSQSYNGGVSLFCGSLVFIALGVYFVSKNFTLKDKIANGIILFAFLMLCYFKPLEYIANGFRDITSYWYRYSYIIIAFLIFIAARVLSGIENEKRETVIKVTLFEIMLVFVTNYFEKDATPVKFICITAVLMLIYALIYDAYANGKEWFKKFGSVALAALLFAELGLNAIALFRHEGFSSASEYKEYYEKRAPYIEETLKNDTTFYRIAQEDYRFLSNENLTSYYNDSYALGYPGIGHYSSTYANNQANLMAKLGYASDPTVPCTNVRMLAPDSLLSVKYFISEDGIKENKYFIKPALVYSTEVTSVYDENPFEYVNQLYTELLGKKTKIYKKVKIKYKLKQGKLTFKAPKKKKNRITYFALNTNGWTTGKVYCNNKFVSVYSFWLTPQTLVLDTSKKKEVEVRYDFAGNKDDINDVYCYSLDTKALKKAAKALNKKAVSDADIRYEKGKITVFADADKKGMNLFLSVPVSPNWTVTDNGEKIKTNKFAGTFYSIPLQKGENVIEMTYDVAGFSTGKKITALAMLLSLAYTAYLVYEKRKEITE